MYYERTSCWIEVIRLLSDERLASEIKNGNEAAVEILVNRHYDTVYSYISRKIGDHHRAYDLTQEVFIRMMNNIGNISLQEGKFANWLLKIAVNICRDYYRSSAYRQTVNTCQLEEEAEYGANIVSIMERKENIKLIKEALAKLPADQREAVILKYFHDRKFTEIAEITESNESTVKSRVRLGMSKLKEILLKGDEDNGRSIKRRNG